MLTGLVWQQIPLNDSITWEQALTYADTLVLASYTDWRLPNIKELQSINDENLINPSVNQTYFSGVTTNHYWSSTTLPNQQTKAWYLDTQFGITTYQFKTNRLAVLCVRGGDITTGIQQTNPVGSSFSIYPNPSSGRIEIKSENNLSKVQVMDLTGQKVIQEMPNAKSFSFHINQNGIYFLRVSTNVSTQTQMIFISGN